MISPKIKVGLIEDSESFRQEMEIAFLGAQEFDLVFSFDSIEAFQNDLPEKIDVLLLDINLPGKSGIAGISQIKKELGQVEIIMFTIFNRSDLVFDALCAGASGYLLKTSSIEDVKKGIKEVNAGYASITPAIARKVIQFFRPKKSLKANLSPREREIIDLLTQGLSFKMIADELNISINTVRTHTKKIYKKLEVNSRAELFAKITVMRKL
ncbi:MAG: response regulator transcription factor [Bacteroidota bacterium]